MKTTMKKLVLSTAFGSALVASATTITGVSANQRWPWNNLMDVDFTISGSTASMAYRVELSATYNGGSNKVYAKSYLTEPVFEGDGQKRVTWDLGADCPDLKADDFAVTVIAAPLVGNDVPVYMVIDLSSGTNSVKYPVRYTTVVPNLNDDKCRTTEMWLRRIRTGVEFPMGGNDSGMTYLNPTKTMKLTKDYYMAIFETTQQQWAQVLGAWPSFYSNATYRATRPVDSLTRNIVRGTLYYYPWPNTTNVGVNSFAGKMRARTGLSTFDLPTEAQWEYAARAGTVATDSTNGKRGSYSSLGPITDDLVPKIARCSANGGGNSDDGNVAPSEVEGEMTGTIEVGHYVPNDWGLYDMLGNVREMVLDRWADNWPDEMSTTDYKGPATGNYSVAKGSPNNSGKSYASVRMRACIETSTANTQKVIGARFCVTLE